MEEAGSIWLKALWFHFGGQISLSPTGQVIIQKQGEVKKI